MNHPTAQERVDQERRVVAREAFSLLTNPPEGYTRDQLRPAIVMMMLTSVLKQVRWSGGGNDG